MAEPYDPATYDPATGQNTDAFINDVSGYGGSGGAQVGLLGRIFGSQDPSTVDASGLTSGDRRAPVWAGLLHSGILGLAAGGKMFDYQRAPLLAQMGAALGGIPDSVQKAKTAAAQQRLIAAQVPELAARTKLYGAQSAEAQRKVEMAAAWKQALSDPAKLEEALRGLSPSEQAEARAAAAAGDYEHWTKVMTERGQSALREAQTEKLRIEAQQERDFLKQKAAGGGAAPAVPPPVPQVAVPPTPVVPPPTSLPLPLPNLAGVGVPPPTQASEGPPDLKTVPQPLRLNPQTPAQMTGAPVAQVPLTPEQRAIVQPPPPTAQGQVPVVGPSQVGQVLGKDGVTDQQRNAALQGSRNSKEYSEALAKFRQENLTKGKENWKPTGRTSGDQTEYQDTNTGKIEWKGPLETPEKKAALERERLANQIKAETEAKGQQAATAGLIAEGLKEHAKHTAGAEAAQKGLDNNAYLGALLGEAYSGRFAGTTTDFITALKGMGFTSEDLAKYGVRDKSSVSEAARAFAQSGALDLRNPAGGAGMPGSLSDGDRNFLEKSTANLNMTQEGRQLLLEMRNKLYQRTLILHQLSLGHVGGGDAFVKDPLGAQRIIAQYNKDHPVFTQEDQDRIRAVNDAAKPKQAGGGTAPTILKVEPGHN